MNRDDAKQVLLLCRGRADAESDRETAEALALAKEDRELGEWLAQQQALHANVRRALRGIEPPDELRSKILDGMASESPARSEKILTLWPMLAMAAVFVAMLTGVFIWNMPSSDRDFGAYRRRMAAYALREYRMDLVTRDPAKIREYLRASGEGGNFQLRAELKRIPQLGCAALHWQGRPVSLVCFEQGGGQLLWYFVVDSDAVSGAPKSSSPEFAQIGKMATASWREGNKVYLLGGIGNKGLLEKFL